MSADATLAAGDVIGTSADGQAQPLTVGTETTVYTCGQAITAGADPDTIELLDQEDVPLAYLPGNATRIRLKVVGDLNG